MSRLCSRCDGGASMMDQLAFKQYRDAHGDDPVLCRRCRNELVRWIERGQEGYGAV